MDDRSGFQREFVRLLTESPEIRGRVLDIGCGGGIPRALSELTSFLHHLDGVDPDPCIHRHANLTERWQAPFEDSQVPGDSYDLAYAYNVLEHVAEPCAFFRKVHSCLKPNGVFLGLTPNGCHPFAILSRGIELAGLKRFARTRVGRDDSGAWKVNDYPAYYRCNSPASIRRAVRGLGFRRVDFYYYPCLQWDMYFPQLLRWLPRTYDRVIGTNLAAYMQIFVVRLQR